MAKFKVGDKVRITEDLNSENVGKVGVIRKEDVFDGTFLVETEDGILWKFGEYIEIAKEGGNMPYKTEKRHAKVGERILITNAKTTFGAYGNGDVFTVKSMYDDGVTQGVEVVENENAPQIFHVEYEVIVEDTPQFPHTRLFEAEAEIDALKTRIKALESELATLKTAQVSVKFNVGDRVRLVNYPYILHDNQQTGTVVGVAPYGKLGKYTVKIDNYGSNTLTFDTDEIERLETEVKAEKQTANQRRADVIKRAMAFVADKFFEGNHGVGRVVSGHHGHNKFQFHVNAEKRTVVAVLSYAYVGGVAAKGIAKCAPDDVFNADIGKAIALARALGVEVPQEFVNAPKPDEVVVGMNVKVKGNAYSYVDKVTVNRTFLHSVDRLRKNPDRLIAILEDTEAQYDS